MEAASGCSGASGMCLQHQCCLGARFRRWRHELVSCCAPSEICAAYCLISRMSRSETRQACSDRYNLRDARVPRTQLAGSGARMAVHSPHSLAHCSSGSGRLRPTAELARFDSVKSGSGGATGIFIAPSWSLNGHSI